MTVGELLEALKQYKHDLAVVVEDVDVREIINIEQPFPPHGSVYLTLEEEATNGK